MVGSPSFDVSFEAHLLAEKRRHWMEANFVSALSPMVGVLVMAALEWRHAKHRDIVTWLEVIMIVFAVQMTLPRCLRRVDNVLAMRLLVAYAALVGLSWALLIVLVRPGDFAFQAFEVLVLCLVGAGGSVVNANHRPFLFAFLGASMGTATVVYAFRDGELSTGIAATLLVLTLTFIAFGLNFHRSYVRSVELGFENARLVRELTAKSVALQQTSAAKTRFLAAASHDLRQPMHAISLLAGLLAEQPRSDAQRNVIERINESASAMESLLNGILDLSRLDAGSEHPQVSSIAVEFLLLRLERTFAGTAASRGLSLRMRPSRRWVASDVTMLTRVLDNLVGNALRYTHAGGVLVAARPRGIDHVAFEVWDTGVGIPAEKLDDIFAEFVQLHNPARDRTQGLGLGLSIVRRTAQLLGHSIEVRSRVGRGTVFRLVVPVTPAPTRNELDVLQADDLDVSGLSVLVVDDEEPIRHAMSALLTSWGCIAHAAQDAATALRLLPTSEAAPDAVLCDYRLSGETGLDVVASLRTRWQRNTAALVVTGDISAAQLREIADSGLQVMHKPVNPVRLRSWLAVVRASACH